MAYVLPIWKVRRLAQFFKSNVPIREAATLAYVDKNTVCSYYKRWREIPPLTPLWFWE